MVFSPRTSQRPSERPAITTGWLATVGLWSLSLWLVAQTAGWTTAVEPMARRLEYATREALGLGPTLSPQLKIVGLDDQAVSFLKTSELSLSDWASLIDAIGRRRPRAIVIDKIFSLIPDDPRGLARLIEALERNPVVHVGASLATTPNKWRDPLSPSRPEFSLERMLPDATAPDWLAIDPVLAYGPDPRLAPSCRGIGHISITAAGGIRALTRIGPRAAVPYLGLSSMGPLSLRDELLFVGDRQVPVGRDGILPVNLASVAEFYAHTLSLRRWMVLARQGIAIPAVEEGDVVLILPLLYTGNVDVEQTPVGRLPRGFFHAAVIQSLLTGRWLTVLGGETLWLGLGCTAGAALAVTLGSLWFWLVFVSVALSMVALGLGGFALLGVISPWPIATLGFVLCGVTVFARRMQATESNTREIKRSLGSVLPADLLTTLLADPGRLRREASERIVTLMFIDIVDFSTYAEDTPPREVFETLRVLLDRLTKCVHRHGGVVDKTLGDGMLCFFGYRFDGAPAAANQADHAIACALEIQRENAASIGRGDVPLPLRIGLNTGNVYIGDLGNAERLDFTVVGNAVNLAKRVESACEPHTVMMAQTTLDLSKFLNSKTPGLRYRMIPIKHHAELLRVVEVDPLYGDTDLRASLASYRQTSESARRNQRWPVLFPQSVSVTTDFGPALLVDFSLRGLSLRMSDYLAKGVPLKLSVAPAGTSVSAIAASAALETLFGDVRWGRPVEGGFLHGVLLKNLTDAQADELLDLLRNWVTAEAA